MIYQPPDALERQYGPPVTAYRDVKGRVGHLYHFNDYIILVQLLEGVSQSEVYVKEDDTEITEPELKAILSANAYGKQWQDIPEPLLAADGTKTQGWVILETGAFCLYGPSFINNRAYKYAVSVSTHAYVQHNRSLDYN